MARCLGCKKNLIFCECNLTIRNGKPTRRVPGGERTRNFRRNGQLWCKVCGCLVRDGQCSNGTCSTRKGGS